MAEKIKTERRKARPAKPARGRPALDSGAQREKILAVAYRQFIAKGYAGTTLEAIARGARVTKRTIYQHVGNKEELFRVICKERLPLAEQLQFEVPLEGRNLTEVVTAVSWQLLHNSFAPEAIALERILTIEGMRFPKLVGEVIDEGMSVLNGNIAAIFDDLARRGDIPPIDPALRKRTADIFYDTIIGNRVFRLTMGHNETIPDEDELNERVAMFIHGYLLRLPGQHKGL
jgi:AcrR family transcriptional regulator